MTRRSLSQQSGVAFAQNIWSSSSRYGWSSPDAFSFQEHRNPVVPLYKHPTENSRLQASQ